MGGNRSPEKDSRTLLYKEFARCLKHVQPKFFVAENVAGLKAIQNGRFLREQVEAFNGSGVGYAISAAVLNARDYGIPQSRKRLFIVGVRRDLNGRYIFPRQTHGRRTRRQPELMPYTSHGEQIAGLPLWPQGEFYERPHDPEGHWSWYYMSRNRKASWDAPSYTVVANWRHVTLHPASPAMSLTWSNLSDGWKQRWDFTTDYEHLEADQSRPTLREARRLSWRECAAIQTFPRDLELAGDTQSKFNQIGNAVPPDLAELIIRRIVEGSGISPEGEDVPEANQLTLF